MDPALDPPDPLATLPPGTRVEVRNRLDGRWAGGFEVTAVGRDGCRLRRLSDGGELPLALPALDVRRQAEPATWRG